MIHEAIAEKAIPEICKALYAHDVEIRGDEISQKYDAKIDFIDMEESAHVEEFLKLLEQEMEKDRVPAKVIDMTALGLVEITRKKVRKPLYELLEKGKGGTYESVENLGSEER